MTTCVLCPPNGLEIYHGRQRTAGSTFRSTALQCRHSAGPASQQIRRVDPKDRQTRKVYALFGVPITVSRAKSIRVPANTGSRKNARRDWVSDELPSDKVNVINRSASIFGLSPIATRATCRYENSRWATNAREVYASAYNRAALSLRSAEFYTGDQFPGRVQERDAGRRARLLGTGHNVPGRRIVKITASPDGKNAKAEVFASGWRRRQGYLGRPDRIILAQDGSILVADTDWAGAIYRLSYSKKSKKVTH